MAEKKKNVAVGLNFDLLKTNLVAMYEENEKGSEILLLPTKVDSPTSVTFEEMIKDFKNVVGMGDNADNIVSSLQSVKKNGSTFQPEKITVSLQSAYLYKTIPKVEGNESELDYAIAVSVDMADALPDFGFFKINSLFLAVWNTDKKVVLKQIGCGSITELLKELDA